MTVSELLNGILSINSKVVLHHCSADDLAHEFPHWRQGLHCFARLGFQSAGTSWWRGFGLACERGLVDRDGIPDMNPLRISARLRWLSWLWSLVWISAVDAEPQTSTVRSPQGTADQAEWLENMIRFHRFTAAEIRDATGLGDEVIAAALKQWGPTSEASASGTGSKGFTHADGTIGILPYPGGRHPRLGFLRARSIRSATPR